MDSNDLNTVEDPSLVGIFKKIFQRLEELSTKVLGTSGGNGAIVTTTGQTVGNNSTVSLAFSSEVIDEGGYHDNSSNNSHLTAPSSGWYIVTGTVTWSNNTSGRRIAGILQGGATAIATARGLAAYGSGFGDLSLNVSAVVKLDAGDYVELTAFQDSGGDRTVDARFAIAKL